MAARPAVSMPIGFRRELSGVRHHELLLARDRAILQDLELEVSHQLGDAIRDLDLNYGLTQTNFNRRVAAEAEVVAVNASYECRPRHARSVARRPAAPGGSRECLLSVAGRLQPVYHERPLPQGLAARYDGVYLAEGPWPAKAYFDAMRQARKRDAGHVHGLRLHAAERHEPRAGAARLHRRLRNGRCVRRIRRHVALARGSGSGRYQLRTGRNAAAAR